MLGMGSRQGSTGIWPGSTEPGGIHPALSSPGLFRGRTAPEIPGKWICAEKREVWAPLPRFQGSSKVQGDPEGAASGIGAWRRWELGIEFQEKGNRIPKERLPGPGFPPQSEPAFSSWDRSGIKAPRSHQCPAPSAPGKPRLPGFPRVPRDLGSTCSHREIPALPGPQLLLRHPTMPRGRIQRNSRLFPPRCVGKCCVRC